MKNNSAIYSTVVAIFCFMQFTFAQANLANNEFGVLIKNWLDQNKEEFHLSDNDLSSLLVSDAYYSRKTRINHVYLNQAHKGIKIHNAISSVAVRAGEVFFYKNRFLQNVALKVNVIAPVVSAETAIQAVASKYKLGTVSNLKVKSKDGSSYVFSKGSISQNEIPVTLVYCPIEDGTLKLAWNLRVKTIEGHNWYSVRVDAVNGQVIESNNLVLKCNIEDITHFSHASQNTNERVVNYFNLHKSTTSVLADGSSYNVLALPLESPLYGSFSLVKTPADGIASPYGWHDTDGKKGPEYTITRGNNVWAMDDVDGNDDQGGKSPEGTSSLTFNFPFDEAKTVEDNLEASLTNLFYVNNVMHDIWYQYGFDEASGNFQFNNYGNGGLANDYVKADGQDGAGLDNATFSTPIDGESGEMTMFLFGGEVKPLTVNSGGPLIGNVKAAVPAKGANGTVTGPSDTPVTADFVLVDDGTDKGLEGCDTLTNADAVKGKIALIIRGNCNFIEKIRFAEDAGAVAVIMINHDNPDNDDKYTEYVNMSGKPDPAFVIPSIFINNVDGQEIIDALKAGEVINGTILKSEGPKKDGSLDNVIIAHEYGHGISTRLTGGASNSGCLANKEQMGEGWSDWFGLMVTMKATDLGTDGRGVANYVLGQTADGIGLRKKKYSTDTTIDPYTYGDTSDSSKISGVHAIGSVWGAFLWDLSWAYIDKYGFDADMYNGTGGNNKIMQIVIDGLKLNPCKPGFVDGRDAILAAEKAITGGVDQCLMWDVFAARGLGKDADQGSSDSVTDQVEDFNAPPKTDESLKNCDALSVESYKTSGYSIFPNPTDNTLTISVKHSFGDVSIVLTDINGRTVLTKNKNLTSKTALNIGALQSGVYILRIKGALVNTVDKIIKN